MELVVESALKNWLANKNKDTLTIDVIITRGGGCCGGCAYAEAIIDFGKPREKPENFLLYEKEGLKIYIAKLLEKKSDLVTLFLKGSLFKRVAIKGFDPDCIWK